MRRKKKINKRSIGSFGRGRMSKFVLRREGREVFNLISPAPNIENKRTRRRRKRALNNKRGTPGADRPANGNVTRAPQVN